MSKHHFIALLFAFVVPAASACATDGSEIVEDVGGKLDDFGQVKPHGEYRFEETLNGLPSSGDLLTLSLAPSGTFSATVSDEISGTTSHTGTFKLFHSSNRVNHYIDFIESSGRQRFEYSIDVVDESTLWLEAPGADHWYGLWFLGDDCRTAGCATGNTCNECFGENVCLPDGTSC